VYSLSSKRRQTQKEMPAAVRGFPLGKNVVAQKTQRPYAEASAQAVSEDIPTFRNPSAGLATARRS
jgi:hypothetical protein